MPSNVTTEHYFESHVTVSPVNEIARVKMKHIAEKHGFRVAEFLYKKTGAVATPDEFMTARSGDYWTLYFSTQELVHELKENNFRVERYKLENTLVDVRL